MDAKDKFAKFLKDKALRQSRPRDIVVDVFLRTERHVTTQELFELVQKKNARVGYATVSRTLKLLEEAGLCRTVDFADGAQRFEHLYGHEHHDHLVCALCGAFVEIYSKKLEDIQDELVAQHGYKQINHRLQIFGVCPRCLKKPRTKEKK